MESQGAKLKKIRLEKGISLEEVQKKTKIHMDILKAIEEDSLINLSPVYIKGFLKIYCKFLGLDPAKYITEYKSEQNITSPAVANSESTPSLRQKLQIKLSFINARNLKIVFTIIVTIILATVLFRLGKFLSSRRAKSISKRNVVSAAAATVRKPTAAAKTSKSENLAIIRLAIRAKENCWIQLKADEKILFQGILKKGRTESWEAKHRIELSLGNAAGVDLEINGKLIPSLGRRGQALKNISITKEGLSITR